MTSVRVHSGAEPREIHPAWLSRALPDIADAGLREAILGADRFAGRIADILLGTPSNGDAPAETGAKLDPALARLLDHLEPSFLIRVGQLWLAPLLATRILAPLGRSGHGLDDRQNLRLVLQYRDHADPSLRGELPAEPDYAQEGGLCVVAWLQQRSGTPAADRTRLTLAPATAPEGPVTAARATLVDRILADNDICGE